MSKIDGFNCPPRHYEILKGLLNGRFLTHDEVLYNIVSDNIIFYKEFFEKSYKVDLEKTAEYIYILSEYSNETFSRNFLLLLSVIAWEFNIEGKNLYEEFDKKHTINEIKEKVKNSSYKNSCRNIDIDKIFREARNRNIIKYIEENVSFKFTSAINMFLNTAKHIAEVDINKE